MAADDYVERWGSFTVEERAMIATGVATFLAVYCLDRSNPKKSRVEELWTGTRLIEGLTKFDGGPGVDPELIEKFEAVRRAEGLA